MPQPANLAELEEPVLRAYAQAWSRVVAEQQLLADNPAKAARSKRLAEMRSRIESIMDELDDIASSWIKGSLPKAYALGGVAGVAEATGGVGQFVWSEIHQEAVQRLATNLFQDLLGATKGVRNSTKQLIRTVARDQALAKAIEGKTATQAGSAMQRILDRKGISAVTYKDGSKHGLKEYAQMAMRTTTASAYNEGTIRGAEGEGVKYWECFDGPTCSLESHDQGPLAAGLVLPKEDALKYLISHPNCRRSWGARPDVRTKEQAKAAQPSVDVQKLRELGEGPKPGSAVPRPTKATPEAKAAARERRAARHRQRAGDEQPAAPVEALPGDALPGEKFVDKVPSVTTLIDQGFSGEKAVEEYARLLKNARNRDRRARDKAKVGGDDAVGADKKLQIGDQPKALYDEDGGAPGPGGGLNAANWWDRIPKDTAEGDFIPVRGLLIQGHRVETGIAIRRGGRSYLIETTPGTAIADSLAEIKAVADKVESSLSGVPVAFRKHQKSVAVVKGKNPKDAFWAEQFDKDGFTSAATGGNGSTTFWNTEVKPGVVLHEFGHNVDSSHGAFGGWFSEVGTWEDSKFKDALSSINHTDFQTSIYGGHKVTPGSAGVTTYGANNTREDFAESVRLFFQDRHTGYLGYSGQPPTSVRFSDVFPERSKELEDLFGLPPIGDTPFQVKARLKAVELVKANELISAGQLSAQTGLGREAALKAKQFALQSIAAEKQAAALAAEAAKLAAEAAAKAALPKITAKDLSFGDKTGIGVKASNAKKAALKAGKTDAEAQAIFVQTKQELTTARIIELGGAPDTLKIVTQGAPDGRMYAGMSEPERGKAARFLDDAGKEVSPGASKAGYFNKAQQAKSNISAELAARLNNPTDWEIFRRTKLATGYGDIGAYDTLTVASRRSLLKKETSDRVQGWAASSGDSQLNPVMMQRAIKEEFQTTGDWMVREDGYLTRAQVDAQYPKVQEFYRRFARVMYENTQEELAKAGITRVSVTRGMDFNSRPAWAKDGAVTRPDLQPANSWSVSTSVARRFGAVRFQASVPASRILGSARTGFGCLNEGEYVILVSDGEAAVGAFS